MEADGSTAMTVVRDRTVGSCGTRGKHQARARLYRFHATDGYDLVVDRAGKRLPTSALVRRHAEGVALKLMLCGNRLDWSAWSVEVYDEAGWVVMRQAFKDVRDTCPAGAALRKRAWR